MMKHMARILLLLIVTLLCLTSCGSAHIQLELALCGSYAVPGMFCPDLKGETFFCSILEEDDQGRILYEYTTKNQISETKETALVICQRIDDSYVYFYEDICYLESGYTQDDIANLKSMNDWDAPVEESKLSRRTKNISFDLFIMPNSQQEYNAVRRACIQATGLLQDQVTVLSFLDTDEHGNVLYLFAGTQNSKQRQYLVLVDEAYRTFVMEIVEGSMDPDEISVFKQDNGWIYGY